MKTICIPTAITFSQYVQILTITLQLENILLILNSWPTSKNSYFTTLQQLPFSSGKKIRKQKIKKTKSMRFTQVQRLQLEIKKMFSHSSREICTFRNTTILGSQLCIIGVCQFHCLFCSLNNSLCNNSFAWKCKKNENSENSCWSSRGTVFTSH